MFVGVFLDFLLEINIDLAKSADDYIRTCPAIGGNISHRVVDFIVGARIGGGVGELFTSGLDDGVDRFLGRE